MDFQTIKDIGTLITLFIAIYSLLRNNGKDIQNNAEKMTEQFTKLNWKQDENCRTLSSMDKNIDKLCDKITGIENRVIILETKVEQMEGKNHER